MDVVKQKEMDWAGEVRYLCELRSVSIKSLAEYMELGYRSLLYRLKNGIDHTERNTLLKAVNVIAESRF